MCVRGGQRGWLRDGKISNDVRPDNALESRDVMKLELRDLLWLIGGNELREP